MGRCDPPVKLTQTIPKTISYYILETVPEERILSETIQCPKEYTLTKTWIEINAIKNFDQGTSTQIDNSVIWTFTSNKEIKRKYIYAIVYAQCSKEL